MSIVFAAIPAAIYLAAGFPATSGGMTIGTLVAFTALQSGIFRPLMGLLNLGAQWISSMALFSRIFGYLDLPVEVAPPVDPTRIDPTAIRGEVRFESVDYAYPDGDTLALHGIDLAVPAGTTLALVGETGSGKSTLAALVSRLHDPPPGGSPSTATTCATCTPRTWPRSSASSPRRPTSCTPRSATTCCSPARAPARPSCGGPWPPRRSTSSWPACPAGWTPWSARAATGSPVARSSGWPSPARCCATRGCWSSTRPPARWTTTPSASCSGPWTP